MTCLECKELYLKQVCNFCTSNDWYCSSPCDLLMKAKRLNNRQWEDLRKKYTHNDELDIEAITLSIKRRKEL